MTTTAGPKRFPRYTVWSTDGQRPIGKVGRDPVNPNRWVGWHHGARVADVDHTTRSAAVADLQDRDDRNVL